MINNPEALQEFILAPRKNSERPNKPERMLAELISKFEFAYVGDGKLNINGMIPDFWNGDHRLIELYGDYWHRGHNPQDRMDAFAQYGYKCLVIWEHEIKKTPRLVEEKVLAFLEDTVA